MSILGLVAVGFSNVTRQAQRRALDNQLNTQAFYAAESGVNDAITYLADPLNADYTKTTCTGGPFGYVLDAATKVSYTCLIINSALTDLSLSGVPIQGRASPKTITMETGSGANIRTFDIEWSAANGTPANVPAVNTLSSAPAWSAANNLGMVRVDLVPTDKGLDRASLATKGYTFFLYPSTLGLNTVQPIQNTTDGQGEIVYVRCATIPVTVSNPCVARIQLAGTAADISGKYTARVQALYSPVNVRIANGIDSSLQPITWVHGQSVIDSTGKANDVFRRIQVRLPYIQNGLTPAFAIESATSICKRLGTGPTSTTVDAFGIPSGAEAACLIN